MRVIYRGRGGAAVWSAPGFTQHRVLPGDTSDLVVALHVLNRAGLLSLNRFADDHRPVGSCPRCGRKTAVLHWWDPPSVCTACRSEWVAEALKRVGHGA